MVFIRRTLHLAARWVLAALAVSGVFALRGCQAPISLYLINHSGHTIEILHSAVQWRNPDGVGSSAWGRVLPWPFLISNGAGREINNQAVGDYWLLDARIAGCRLRFTAPLTKPYSRHDWSAFGRASDISVTTQVEPDGRLFLVPSEARARGIAMDVTPFAPLQPAGFPVAAGSRRCK